MRVAKSHTQVISVNSYVSVRKIGYSSSSVFPFSVVNRFGYSLRSDNVGSINLKKTHISGQFTFGFGLDFRVRSLLNSSTYIYNIGKIP